MEDALNSAELDWTGKVLDDADAAVVAYIMSVSKVLKSLHPESEAAMSIRARCARHCRRGEHVSSLAG